MNITSNLVLPNLVVGQAQAHVAASETLRRIDALIQRSLVLATTTAQPGGPPRVNLASANVLAITGQFRNFGETLTLESHLAALLHGP